MAEQMGVIKLVQIFVTARIFLLVASFFTENHSQITIITALQVE